MIRAIAWLVAPYVAPVVEMRAARTNRGDHYTAPMLACGHQTGPSYSKRPIPNVGSMPMWETLTHHPVLGEQVECHECRHYAEAKAKITGARADGITLAYGRFRPHDSRGSSDGSIHVYAVDHTMPRGVRLFASIESTPESHEIVRLATAGVGALSPTER